MRIWLLLALLSNFASAATINSQATGNGAQILGPYTIGNCPQFAAGGNFVDSGSACGGGGGGGGVTGSGAAGQVTYWSGASAVTGSNLLFWDTTDGRLGINTNLPSQALSVIGNISLASSGNDAVQIFGDGENAPTSLTGFGNIIYNNAQGSFQTSTNGNPYANIGNVLGTGSAGALALWNTATQLYDNADYGVNTSSGILYATGGLDTVDTPATVNLYVNASTGSDSNPCTIASPCLTIAHTASIIPLVVPGIVQVNIADGTYNESELLKDIIGPAGDATYGNSVIKFIGDTAVPNNVVWNTGSAGCGIEVQYARTSYVFDGFDFTNDGGSGHYAFCVKGVFVDLRDVDFTAVGGISQVITDGILVTESTANGGTYSVTGNGFIAFDGGKILLGKNFTLTGVTNTGIGANQGGLIDLSGLSSFSITGDTSAGMNNGILAYGAGAIISLPYGATIGITHTPADNASRCIGDLSGGTIDVGNSNTFNLNNCALGVRISENSQYWEDGANTWNFFNITDVPVDIDANASIVTYNNFSQQQFAAISGSSASGRHHVIHGSDVASATTITLGQGNDFNITGTTPVSFINTAGFIPADQVTLTLAGPTTLNNNVASPPGGFSPIHIINGSNFNATVQRANITLKLSNDTTTWDEIAGEDGSQPLTQGSISAGPNIQITGTGSNPIIDAAPNNIDLTATGIPFTVPDTNNANIFADTTAGAIAINQPATPLAGQEIVITNVGTGNVSYTANTPPDVFTIPIGTSQTFRYYDTATQWRPVALNGDLSFIANANATAANVPMNGFGFTGMASGVNPQDAVTVSQLPVDPAASSVVAITAGTAFQNTSGGDLIISGTAAVTVGVTGTVQIGVGTTSTPTTNDITPSLTTPQNVAFSVRVPKNSYLLITPTGTVTITSVTAISS